MSVPTHIPERRPRAKVLRAHEAAPEARPERRNVPQHPLDAIDWLAIWVLSLGFCASVMAGLVYFDARDTTGAAFILTGAAIIMAVALWFTQPPDESQ
jgi:hypothetical protein